MSTSRQRDVSARPLVSRRAVVRAAAHAAWAVPAVQIATTVPGSAAASDSLEFTSGGGSWDNTTYPRTMDVTAGVRATGSTSALQVTVTFPNLYAHSALLGIDLAVSISNVTGGWSAGAPTYTGTGVDRTATVVFTATTQARAGTTRPLAFRVTTPRLVSDTQAGGDVDTLTLRATSTGHAPAAISINPVAG